MALTPATMEPDLGESVARRFWVKVQKTEGCWLWTAAARFSTGYGNFYLDGHYVAAHRVAWMLLVGPIPEGMELDHTCHNADLSCRGGSSCIHRLCVRPDHLEPVTHQENCKRGERGRRRDVCAKGHALTPGNLLVLPRGSRECRLCARLRQREWQRRKLGILPENYRV